MAFEVEPGAVHRPIEPDLCQLVWEWLLGLLLFPVRVNEVRRTEGEALEVDLLIEDACVM